jgi:hypothetical protein
MLSVGATMANTMLTYRACVIVALAALLISCKGNDSRTDELTVKLDNLTTREDRSAKLAEMRQFLWNHWTTRKPANLFFAAVSKEGMTSHSEYRISLLPGNTILLKVSVVRDRIGYQGQVIPKDDGGYEACTIERVQSENPFGVGAETKITVLPVGASVPPAKYWLRLKGWNDTLITYF